MGSLQALGRLRFFFEMKVQLKLEMKKLTAFTNSPTNATDDHITEP